jgi:hypothetical protein
VRAKHAEDVALEGGFLFTFECAIIANNSIALGIARNPFSMHQQGQYLMIHSSYTIQTRVSIFQKESRA